MLKERFEEKYFDILEVVKKLKNVISKRGFNTKKQLLIYLYNHISFNENVSKELLVSSIDIGFKILTSRATLSERLLKDFMYEEKPNKNILILWSIIDGRYDCNDLYELFSYFDDAPTNFNISQIKTTFIEISNSIVDDSVSEEFVILLASSISLRKKKS